MGRYNHSLLLDAIILKDIDPKKATGWDTIPPKAFKMGSTVLAAPLCDLYNHCIESCHWPKNWKRGEWVPIHKKNDRLDMENYRPVSVQTIINKVFEKLLANQITAGFNERLSDYLTAYRKRHSCETTFLMLTENGRMQLIMEKVLVYVLRICLKNLTA